MFKRALQDRYVFEITLFFLHVLSDHHGLLLHRACKESSALLSKDELVSGMARIWIWEICYPSRLQNIFTEDLHRPT